MVAQIYFETDGLLIIQHDLLVVRAGAGRFDRLSRVASVNAVSIDLLRDLVPFLASLVLVPDAYRSRQKFTLIRLQRLLEVFDCVALKRHELRLDDVVELLQNEGRVDLLVLLAPLLDELDEFLVDM